MEITLDKQKTAYYLCQKDRVFRDKTLSSIYFLSNKPQVEKKSRPVDIDGVRYKMNLESGEISNYTKKEVLHSMNSSLRRTKILMNMLLEMNDFDWFCTLTFDKQKIDRTNDELVFNAYKKYINNVKKQFPSFRYMCFPERHEDNCIHFHLLIGGLTTQQLGLENSGKVCCSWAYRKNKIASKEFYESTKHEHENELTETDGLVVYNVTTFPYGFTTVTRIASRERCNSYVKKYVEKALGSTEIFKKRFYYSSNLNIPSTVERQIGADFKTPKDLTLLNELKNDLVLQNADYVNYNKDHNTLQYWIDTDKKHHIDNGLIPLSEEESLELGEIFI